MEENSLCELYEWKERHVLFNNALNTFYLQLYGFGHMVVDHSARKNNNIHITSWATLSNIFPSDVHDYMSSYIVWGEFNKEDLG